MGASNSKEFERSPPRRKSRRKFYGVLKHNFELIEHKLQPERLTDDEYEIVSKLINQNHNDLLAIAEDVRDKSKYRSMYEEGLQMCERFGEMLRTKRMPVSAPSSPSTKKRRKKKLERKERKSLLTPDEQSCQEIDRIRHEMVPLRDEVLTFKGLRNDRIYHFLQESFHRYARRLASINTHDRVQLKYELKLAIKYAQESQDVLDEICDGRLPIAHQLSLNHEGYPVIEEVDASHVHCNMEIKRNLSKSMGDFLHHVTDVDFPTRKKSSPECPEYSDDSDSEYGPTSDFSDVPMTPLTSATPQSRRSSLAYNFKVTAL